MTAYDAIVIGAGPSGATAALLLARAGWSVAVVEKASFPRRKVCGEFISAPALSLLAEAGVADDVLARAGPEVREIAVYAGERMVSGTMPRSSGEYAYGRALGREHLDSLLLAAAARAGAVVWQPWRVERTAFESGRHVCCIERKQTHEKRSIAAPIVIAAHGSWETGGVALPRSRAKARASDLFGFKAHFSRGALHPGCMPLIAFPGGYGGLVTSDSGRTSFSCCLRRDALAASRAATPGAAGDAVLAHVLASCRGVRRSLEGATREGAWLAAGPLRPGVRGTAGAGYFAVGNAMGEAHPIVAEGISMAIQSAWLLCDRLLRHARREALFASDDVHADYEKAYRQAFATRIRASSAFSMAAMNPHAAAAIAGVLDVLPGLVSLGARWAGKASPLLT